MKKSRYSEESIVRILREADRDTVVDVAKRHGVSEASIYAWRRRIHSTLGYISPMKFLEDWIGTQHEQQLAA